MSIRNILFLVGYFITFKKSEGHHWATKPNRAFEQERGREREREREREKEERELARVY